MIDHRMISTHMLIEFIFPAPLDIVSEVAQEYLHSKLETVQKEHNIRFLTHAVDNRYLVWFERNRDYLMLQLAWKETNYSWTRWRIIDKDLRPKWAQSSETLVH